GALAGAIIVLHDVSESKARERALIAAREEAVQARRWLLASLDAMPLGLAVFDAEGRLALCNAPYRALNPGLEDMLIPGAAFADILAASLERGLREIGDADPQTWIAEEIARGRAPGGAEAEILLANGRWVWRQTHAMPTGETIALRIDITDRKLRKEELEQARDRALAASRAKSEFISVMSHELRTPLNGVLGFAGILACSSLSDDQRKHVERITESGMLLLTLLNDILDAAALEADQVTLEEAPVTLAALAEDVAAVHRSAAAAKGLTLTVAVAADAPEAVAGDAARLRQVLGNLLANAVKFTETGSVGLRVRKGRARGGRTEIVYEVSDTGVGIAPDAMARLFDAYAQADASMTRKFSGVGLGLTICHRLTALMGGTIEVVSAPGEGALFRVVIPHNPAKAAPVAAPLRFAARA
ncbi:MAG: hybrid sensor histidine kinase/response regulator, partial [Alphaproteobacteria bacterium HGW-Alphaproteobacteria-8]